jgi:acetyl esterase/lipase
LVLSVLAGGLLAAQLAAETNVIYGMHSGLALLMDVHTPAKPNGFGIVVIPGSGWHAPAAYAARPLKDSKEFGVHVRKLVEAGYTAFVINHRAAPRFHYPAAVEDAQRAVRFVRHHAARYGIKADRLGALGASSGGHLVNLLGVLEGKGAAEDPDPVERESAKVQCVVSFYAPSQLATIDTPRGLVAVALFMWARQPGPGTAGGPEAKLYADASPVTHVTPDDPPFLLIHGDGDRTVPFQQSVLMEEALTKSNVPVKLIRVPGGGHGPAFAGATESVDVASHTLEWFEAHLRRK